MRISDWSSDVCSSDLPRSRFPDGVCAFDFRPRYERMPHFLPLLSGPVCEEQSEFRRVHVFTLETHCLYALQFEHPLPRRERVILVKNAVSHGAALFSDRKSTRLNSSP